MAQRYFVSYLALRRRRDACTLARGVGRVSLCAGGRVERATLLIARAGYLGVDRVLVATRGYVRDRVRVLVAYTGSRARPPAGIPPATRVTNECCLTEENSVLFTSDLGEVAGGRR